MNPAKMYEINHAFWWQQLEFGGCSDVAKLDTCISKLVDNYASSSSSSVLLLLLLSFQIYIYLDLNIFHVHVFPARIFCGSQIKSGLQKNTQETDLFETQFRESSLNWSSTPCQGRLVFQFNRNFPGLYHHSSGVSYPIPRQAWQIGMPWSS